MEPGTWNWIFGGLAQLARAPALHAGGQGFDSLILHIRGLKVARQKMRERRKARRSKRSWNIGILDMPGGIVFYWFESDNIPT